MSAGIQQATTALPRAADAARSAVRRSLAAALTQARKRLLEQSLGSDARALEHALIALADADSRGSDEPKPSSRTAQIVMKSLLERLRKNIRPPLQRLATVASAIDPAHSEVLIDALRPGQCVRELALCSEHIELGDQAWLITGKIIERRWLADLPGIINGLRNRLLPLVNGSTQQAPFVLRSPVAHHATTTAPDTVARTRPDNTTLDQALLQVQRRVHSGQLRARGLRPLREAVMHNLAKQLHCPVEQLELEADQRSAQDSALAMVQPVLAEAARLPLAFSSLFRGLFMVLTRDQLTTAETLTTPDSPWQWLLDELRLALRDGGSRTHWATRSVCSLLECPQLSSQMLNELIASAPPRPQVPEASIEEDPAASPLAARALKTVLDWLRQHPDLPGHVRQMLRRSWSRVLLELGQRHGEASTHYRHAVETGETLCRFYLDNSELEAREIRQLMREIRTGLDGLADHSDAARRVVNDLARSTGRSPGDNNDQPGAGRTLRQHMRLGQWIEWEPRPGEISRGRLSWVSPFSGNYLFVGPFGRRMLELPPTAILEALEDGRLRLTNAEGLTEATATAELLDKMRETQQS